jgi:hypothetical protein
MNSLDKSKIDSFKNQFQGDVLSPDDPSYDDVRQIWNAMIDRKPGLIARCKLADDVVTAVNFARDNSLLVCTRRRSQYRWERRL